MIKVKKCLYDVDSGGLRHGLNCALNTKKLEKIQDNKNEELRSLKEHAHTSTRKKIKNSQNQIMYLKKQFKQNVSNIYVRIRRDVGYE